MSALALICTCVHMQLEDGFIYHFVLVTLEAYDGGPVPPPIRTLVPVGVLEDQDIPLHVGRGLHLPQTQVLVSTLQTGSGARRAAPGSWETGQ